MIRRSLIALGLAAASLYLAFALSALLYFPALAREDRMEATPAHLKSVDVMEKPNAQVPGVLAFIDETGKSVKLEDYFNNDKPIILTLNYLACPVLCTLTLNGMIDCLQEVPLEVGKDYQIVTVSFDPNETKLLAKLKKQSYEAYWGDGKARYGWHILTGKEQQIRTLTQTVGFSYNWVEERQEWAHPAVLIVLTPDGRVSRYIYGVKFDPQTVKLTLVEASKGKIGTPLDKILLFCYHYDSSIGAYAPVAMNIMRLAGGATLIALAIFLGLFWAAEKRRTNENGGTGAPAGEVTGDGARATGPTPGVSNV